MTNKFTLIVIILIVCISCVIYRQRGVTIPKGARLKTDCGYDESLNFYDVKGVYVKNAKIKPFLYKLKSYDGKSKNDYMEFYLVKGENTIILLWGHYEPYPGTFPHAVEEFGFFVGLDTIELNDTLFFNPDSSAGIFYFRRSYWGLHHTGYTRELDGNLLFTSIVGDTLSGIVDFTGETEGYYYSSYHGNYIDESCVSSWISCDIHFKATLEQFEKDSILIGRVSLDLDVNIED